MRRVIAKYSDDGALAAFYVQLPKPEAIASEKERIEEPASPDKRTRVIQLDDDSTASAEDRALDKRTGIEQVDAGQMKSAQNDEVPIDIDDIVGVAIQLVRRL